MGLRRDSTAMTTNRSTMSTTHCLWCDSEITESNLRWPGFDSPACRVAAQQQRERLRQKRIEQRRAKGST